MNPLFSYSILLNYHLSLLHYLPSILLLILLSPLLFYELFLHILPLLLKLHSSLLNPLFHLFLPLVLHLLLVINPLTKQFIQLLLHLNVHFQLEQLDYLIQHLHLSYLLLFIDLLSFVIWPSPTEV